MPKIHNHHNAFDPHAPEHRIPNVKPQPADEPEHVADPYILGHHVDGEPAIDCEVPDDVANGSIDFSLEWVQAAGDRDEYRTRALALRAKESLRESPRSTLVIALDKIDADTAPQTDGEAAP